MPDAWPHSDLRADLAAKLFIMNMFRLIIVGAATVCALVPMPPALIEWGYAAHLYPAIQQTVTGVSNRVPFALFDVFLIGLAAAWLALAIRDLVAGRVAGAALRIAIRTAIWGSVVYLVFLAAWGLNYRGVPLAARLQIDARAADRGAARRLAGTAVDRINALYAASAGRRHDRVPDGPLAAGFMNVASALHLPAPVLGRPKRTLLDAYFERAGVDGMTDPFFLETLIADEVLPFEKPFVVAHEWSHLAGVTDEGEANFVGWLACLRGSAADQYSGWLFLYSELTRAVSGSERASLQASLASGPRDDLRGIRDRVARRVSPRVSAAGWRVYDSYLKANRVEAGSASYDGVVRLVLTTEFRGDWRPVLKP